MKNYFIALLGIISLGPLLLLQNANAQNIDFPISPNAAAYSQYAKSNVNLFTGTNHISIPIWQVNIKGYTLPISLNYNGSGIRVGQVASWVGQGWDLTAGGMIAREVRGFPDDAHENDWGDFYYHLGWIYGLSGDTSAANRVHNFDTEAADSIRSAELLKIIGNGTYKYDTEPDVFHFNFGGRSGSFVLHKGNNDDPEEKNILTIPYQDMEITYELDQSGYLKEFKIIDENGTTFIFNEREKTYTYTVTETLNTDGVSANLYDVDGLRQDYYSGWYLSQIITPFGDIMNLNYDSEQINLDENYLYNTSGSGSGDTISKMTINKTGFYTSTLYTKKLTSISTDNIEVKFKALHPREDMNLDGIKSMQQSKALNAIEVYSNYYSDPELIRSFIFNYEYFSCGSSNTYNSHPSGSKRLFLKTVQQANQGDSYPPYFFHYDYDSATNRTLPSRFSYAQDYWGYYNGYNTNTSLTPDVYVYPPLTGSDRFRLYMAEAPYDPDYDTVYHISGANRRPGPTKVTIGSLVKIRYPSGGWTEFEYESNKFHAGDYWQYGNNKGAGIRLKKRKIYESSNSTPKVLEYEYGTSTHSYGKLVTMPRFGYFDPTYWSVDPDDDINETYFEENYLRTNYNLSGMSDGIIGYDTVIVKTDDIGESIHVFNNPGCYEDSEDDELYFRTSSDYVRHDQDITDTNLCKTTGLHFEYDAYPYPNNLNYNWNRGLLLKKIDKNDDGDVVKEIINTYDLFYADGSGPDTVSGLKVGFLRNDTASLQHSLIVYAKYNIYTLLKKVLSSSEVKIYSLESSTDFISKKNTYYYNDYAQPNKIFTYGSDSSKYISKIKYPVDFDISSPSDDFAKSLSYMKDSLHIHSPVIDKQSLILDDGDEKITGGIIYAYRLLDPTEDTMRVVMDELLSFNTSTPVDPSQFDSLQIDNGEISYDDSYEIKATFEAYDDYGNLLQTDIPDGISSTQIWGYDSTIPIAGILNATSKDCAYEGFEDEDNISGWIDAESCSSYQSVSDSIAYTGTHSLEMISHTSCQAASRYFDDSDLDTSATYVFSAWVIAPETHDLIGIRINYKSNGTWKNASFLNYSDDGNWEYLEFKLDISAITNLEEIETEIRNAGTNDIKCFFDEIRFYPEGAEMTTYSFKPLIGKTSETDLNNITSYLEYDALGRLTSVKDDDLDLIAAKQFYYAHQPVVVTPLLHNFGSIQVDGNSEYSNFYAINLSKDTINLTADIEGYDDDLFSIGSGTSINLLPGDTDTITIRFEPDTLGWIQSTLNLSGSKLENDIDVSLFGLGAAVEVFRDTLTFPRTAINTESSDRIIIINYDMDSVTFSLSISGTDASQFEIEDQITSITVAGQTSKSLDVIFNPTSNGTKTANLTLDPTSTYDDLDVHLTGLCYTPMSCSITGPDTVSMSQMVYYSITGLSGGLSPYSYEWEYLNSNGVYTTIGGNSTSVNFKVKEWIHIYNQQLEMRCTITDSYGDHLIKTKISTYN